MCTDCSEERDSNFRTIVFGEAEGVSPKEDTKKTLITYIAF